MYFGRNKYLNGVIFDGNDKLIGQTVKIKIDKVNQNNLFGKKHYKELVKFRNLNNNYVSFLP